MYEEDGLCRGGVTPPFDVIPAKAGIQEWRSGDVRRDESSLGFTSQGLALSRELAALRL